MNIIVDSKRGLPLPDSVRGEAAVWLSRLHSDSSKAERLAGWRAETSLDQGDTASARGAYLELAEAHRGQGHIDAALDAGYQALSLAPGNVDLHLELIGLYLDRGWRAPAVEKLRLLHRLVDLGDEASARERLQAAIEGDYAELAAEAGVEAVAS